MSGDPFADLRTRLVSGDKVTVHDVAAVAATDAAATLDRLNGEANAERAAATARRARADRVAGLLAEFEAEADRVADRMEKAGDRFTRALDEVNSAEADMSAVVRHYRDELHRNGWNVQHPSEIWGKSGFRIIIDRDHLEKKKLTVFDAAQYARWARSLQQSRDS